MQIDATPAAVLSRIEERLDALGMSGAAASRSAGATHLIPNLRRGSAPSLDTMVRLAEVLDTTPAYLAFGIADDDEPVELSRPRALPPLGSLPIVGEFAAGRWLDVDMGVDESPYDGIAVPPDPAYPAEHQFAAVVRGTSVNKVAPDGSVVSCLDVAKARVRPKSGDLVAVEMTRNNGQERMRTIKRLHTTEEFDELHPDTTDQRWIDRGPMRIRRNAEDESTSITILGIVTWVHRPLDRSERRERD